MILSKVNWRGALRFYKLERLKKIKAYFECKEDVLNSIYMHICREICRRERAEKVRTPKA